jgi:hypothetical protein
MWEVREKEIWEGEEELVYWGEMMGIVGSGERGLNDTPYRTCHSPAP